MKKTVTILNGTSISSAAADFGTMARLKAILMPAAWDAADISFQVSDDGVSFANLIDDANNAVKCTSPGAGKMVGLRQDISRALSRFQFVKIQSGTPGATVNQTADRAIILLADDDER